LAISWLTAHGLRAHRTGGFQGDDVRRALLAITTSFGYLRRRTLALYCLAIAKNSLRVSLEGTH
jgi:hypothetical protein